MSRLLCLILALVCGLLAAPVRAAPVDAGEALALIASGRFPDIEKGVDLLARSGNARAQIMIEALRDGRLAVAADKRVVIEGANGGWSDAATGEALAEAPPAPKAVRLNNRIRRAVEAALGTLTLMAPDAAARRQAAEAVFRSRDVTALATLDEAIAREEVAGIRRLMGEARAAILLGDAGASDLQKIEAVDVLAARADQDALALLRAAAAQGSPMVREAAESAVASVEQRLAVLSMLQNVWYGLSLGSVLLLAAIGLAITFGVMGIINMAHGEMVMIGAYTTFVIQELARTHAPGLFDWTLPVAIPMAFLVAALVGAAIERGIIRHLYGRPLETLLATWGVSLILQQAVRSLFGPSNREVGAPSYMAGAFDLGGLTITYGRLWIVVFSLAVFAALIVALKATSFGLKIRAVTQNRRMAASLGIRTPWVDTMAFALGSGIAGVAGVALSQIDNVSPNLGQSYIVDSFMVVVFGGVGNLWGTLVSALTLGIANKFLEPFAGAVLGKILLLVFLILFIQKRPRGLFALKGRAVEA